MDTTPSPQPADPSGGESIRAPGGAAHTRAEHPPFQVPHGMLQSRNEHIETNKGRLGASRSLTFLVAVSSRLFTLAVAGL